MSLLLLIASAWAHGLNFEMRAVSVSPTDDQEIWGVVESMGVVWTHDGGSSWTWTCQSALGSTRVYDVLALGGGQAVVAALGGVAAVDDACGLTAWTGIPDNSYADALVPDGDDVLVAISGSEVGGVFRCAGGDCEPTGLYDAGLFVKSLIPAGSGFYATTVVTATLSSALWWSADGETWEQRALWDDGSVDPHVVWASGDDLLTWALPRDTSGAPQLLRSEDGGLSSEAVWTGDAYTTASATVIAVGDGLMFGHNQGLVLWSSDDGWTWEDRTEIMPTVVCGADRDGVGYLCADHLYDGFDLASSGDGTTWTPIACLETATLASCAAETCASAVDNWELQASLGGGRCDQIVNPPADADEATGCGCRGKGSETAGLLLPITLLWGLGRRRGRWRAATRRWR